MEQRKNHRQVVHELVESGRLSAIEADRILDAPPVSLPAREIVSYLGALIVGVGVVRLVIAMFEDASRMSISGALFLAALVLGFASIRLADRTGALGRLSEVLELATIASASGSAALALTETDMRGEWVAIIIASVALVWSLIRLGSSRFVSAITLPVSLFVIAGTASALADIDDSLTAGPIAAVGLVLVGLGLTGVRQDVFFRAVGAMALLSSLPGWSSQRPGPEGIIPAVIIAGALFAVGAVRMWLELILPMALASTILVCAYVFRSVDNEVAQGVAVVAVGLVILGGTTVAVRRTRGHGPNHRDRHRAGTGAEHGGGRGPGYRFGA